MPGVMSGHPAGCEAAAGARSAPLECCRNIAPPGGPQDFSRCIHNLSGSADAVSFALVPGLRFVCPWLPSLASLRDAREGDPG
jgi:hypothetical protein